MLLIFVTFVLTTASYGVLAWLAVRRVTNHLRDNPEGVKAVTDHVLIPLLGRKDAVEVEEEEVDELKVKIPAK